MSRYKISPLQNGTTVVNAHDKYVSVYSYFKLSIVVVVTVNVTDSVIGIVAFGLSHKYFFQFLGGKL